MIYNCEISKKISNYASKNQEFVFAIDFDGNDGFVMTPKDAAKSNIFFDIEGVSNFNNPSVKFEKKEFDVIPVPYKDYQSAFDKVLYNIKIGNSYLVNLTFRTEIQTDYQLSEIFELSRAKFKLFYKDKFVIFSPEPFIRIKGNVIESYPMKGTINAEIENAEKIILNDEKEFCEHNTIVDLIRNDLNIVAKNVEVEKFRFVEKIKSNRGDLLQVSSKITGVLPENFHDYLGDIIFKLLPAGSVTGAPKKKTVEIIRDAENYNRGFYTGVFGYFDGKDFTTSVGIRFIEREGNKMYYKSGGGLTAMSNPENEYDELIRKVYVPFV